MIKRILFHALSVKLQLKIDQWLELKIKPAKEVVLGKNHIFVFPSSYGWYYILMMIVLFFGGVNYGNSLIQGFTFLSCSIFILNIFHVHKNLKDLIFIQKRAGACFLGDEAEFEIIVSKKSKKKVESIHISFRNYKKYVFNLMNEESKTIFLHKKPMQRGLFKPGKILIETFFPLGLIRAWSWIDLSFESIIYPAPIFSPWCGSGEGINESESAFNKKYVAGYDDFDGLKVFQQGESLKRVDWKSWARTGELYSKTFINSINPGYQLKWDDFQSSNIESSLSYLAFWVIKLGEENKNFSLELPGIIIPSNEGKAHAEHCLRALALWNSN